MAQEIRRFTWCDVCIGEDGPQEPAETFTVTIGAATPVALDLCERHAKALVTPLQDALSAHGYRDNMTLKTPGSNGHGAGSGRPGKRGVNAGAHPCLWCDISYSSVSGLAGHLAAGHGFPAREDGRASVVDIYGPRCPYCGTEQIGAARLGIHITRNHPGEPAKFSAAMFRARDLGDPHGVVAKVVAKADEHGQYKPPRRRR